MEQAIIVVVLIFGVLTFLYPKPMSWMVSICIFLIATIIGLQNHTLVGMVGGGFIALVFYHSIRGSVEGRAWLEAKIDEDDCSICANCNSKLKYHPYPKKFSQAWYYFSGLTCPNCKSEFDIPLYIIMPIVTRKNRNEKNTIKKLSKRHKDLNLK